MTAWNAVFVFQRAPETVVEDLHPLLTAQGYTLYNPFGLMPSFPYPETVKLFVAPAQGDWAQLIGEPTPELLSAFSQAAPLIWLGLRADEAVIRPFADGVEQELTTWAAQLPPDAVDVDRLLHADQTPDLRLSSPPAPTPLVVPLDALPEDVRKLAANLKPGQANEMFDKMSHKLIKRVGGDAAAAQALMQQADAPQWNSAGGLRLRGVAGALRLPEAWDRPDFVTLRDAYQAAARQQRRPDAPPFPGDAEALAAVDTPLSYRPIFAGRKK